MAILFANNATATLASLLEIADTTIILNAGEGAAFPLPSGGNTFLVSVQDQQGNLEVCEVTARTSDILTVTRARESTTAKEFAVGAVVEMRVTAGMLDRFLQPDDLTPYETTAQAGAKYPLKSLNLSDLASAATARTNLGLGTAAVQNVGFFLQAANNLSDLAVPATARTNLGLGAVATENVLPVAKGGTGATTLEATKTALEIPPAEALVYKCSIRLDNAGVVARANGCSSSKTSTGRWLVTFSTPYAAADRAMLALIRDSESIGANYGPQVSYYNLTTTSVEVQVRNGGNDNAYDDAGWTLVCWELPAP